MCKKTILLITGVLLCSAIILIGAQRGFAVPFYEGGCQDCHGTGFAALNNHIIHSGQACTICHTGAGGSKPVLPSNCIVCHPRSGTKGLCPLINNSLAGASHGQTCLTSLCHGPGGTKTCNPTTTVQSTTTVSGSTTTTVQTECLNDADCDDGVYCNGSESCVAGTCVPGEQPQPVPEICDDGLDNDCDGLIDADDPNCAIETPAFCVTNTCEPKISCSPTLLTFSGTITNCGNMPIYSVWVDSVTGPLTFDPPCPDTLMTGETCNYKGDFGVIGSGGNTATVNARGYVVYRDGRTQYLNEIASDSCFEERPVPGVSCEKTCEVQPDGSITYDLSFTASNKYTNCPQDLINCRIVDNSNQPITWLPEIPLGFFDLAAGKTSSFTGLYTPLCPHEAIEVINSATIVCDNIDPQTGEPVTATCEANCTSKCCEFLDLTVTKDCAPKEQPAGGSVDVFGDVCNRGDVPLTNVTVVDNQGTVLTCARAGGVSITQPFSLAAGECVSCTGTVPCPAGGGQIPDDIFTATGKSPCGTELIAYAGPPAEPCKCAQKGCEVTIEKACANSTDCTFIQYALTVRSSTANSFPISCYIDEDTSPPPPPDITWPAPLPTPGSERILQPGEGATYTGTYPCPDICPTPDNPFVVKNQATVKCTGTGVFSAVECEATSEANCNCSKSTTSSSTTTTTIQQACWLTAGGSTFEPLLGMMMATVKGKGERDPGISFGGNVNPGCSPTAGDGGNWNHIDHKYNLHLQATTITEVECGNIPESIRPPGSSSPQTQFNFLEWTGSGVLKGISGNKTLPDGSPIPTGTVYYYARAEDRNEPGSNLKKLGSSFTDRYWIGIFADEAMTQPIYRFPYVPPGNDVTNPDTICGDDAFPCTDTIAISGGNIQIHESSCDKYNTSVPPSTTTEPSTSTVAPPTTTTSIRGGGGGGGVTTSTSTPVQTTSTVAPSTTTSSIKKTTTTTTTSGGGGGGASTTTTTAKHKNKK